MREKDSVEKYKKRFYVVSIVLVVILCIQGLYCTGVFQTGTALKEGSGPDASAAVEAPADAPASAGAAATGTGTPAVSSGQGEAVGDVSASTGAAAGTGTGTPAVSSGQGEAGETALGSLFHEGYDLEQVVILSRHNIRSPFSAPGSALFTYTPHEWFEWSSNPGELSLRGGASETMMGQYFRKWLEAEGLFPENYHPDEDAVRVYANSKQRTIATAQYFTAGLLPTAGEPIEYHMEYDQMDPVFTPQLTFVTEEYAEDVRAQVKDLFTEKVESLEDNYALLTDVIDMKESESWQENSEGSLRTDDLEIVLENNAEPAMKGSLKKACTISDAMILQYYEEPDKKTAAFGHDLSPEEWKAIGEIKDVYGDVLFTAPLVSPNTAHPLLQEISDELDEDGRQFTFLCGHDSNIGSVLAAIEAEEYVLPETIEMKTPIGSKLVFCRWRGRDGSEKMSVDIVYQTSEQLRERILLDLANPPAVFPVSLQGLDKNEDGLYDAQDVMNRLEKAIEEYDNLLNKYGIEELDNAA